MKFVKYVSMGVCGLSAIGALNSAFIILEGLSTGQVDKPGYFVVKLLAYITLIAALLIAAVKLFKSARSTR